MGVRWCSGGGRNHFDGNPTEVVVAVSEDVWTNIYRTFYKSFFKHADK